MNIVLVSGGYDSAYCMLAALETGKPSRGLFFDYGQPYLRQEQEAVAQLRARHGWNIREVKHVIGGAHAGVFPDRNETFIRIAATDYPKAHIYFGCRCPLQVFDRYGDSNWQFGRRMGRLLGTDVIMPTVMLPKFIIAQRLRRSGLLDCLFTSEGFKYGA